MAIQHRRGAYTNYDPTKMVPGEIAVVQSGDPASTDGKAIYIAITAGNVKRIALYDEMQNLVQNIVLQQTQDIIDDIHEGVEADVRRAESAAATFETDKTLTVTGKAADAKKVGDEISDIKADISDIETIVGSSAREPDTYDLTSSDFTRKLGLNRGTDVAYPYTYTRNDVIGYQEYEIRLKPNTTYEITATVTSEYASSARMLVDMYDQSMIDAYNSRSNIDMMSHHVGPGWGALTQQVSTSRKNSAGETGVGFKFMIQQDSAGTAITDDFDVVSLHVEEIIEDRDGVVVRYDTIQSKTDNEKRIARNNIGAASADDLDEIIDIIGKSQTPTVYDLTSSDFTRKIKFVYGTNTAYPFTASATGFITYAKFDLPVETGKRYKIIATVPSQYVATAGMIVIPYSQTLLDAFENQTSANTSANTNASYGWRGIEQTLTIPYANNGETCVGILLSFRQNSSNVSISDDFEITSVHIEELTAGGNIVRYDVSQSKTDAEKKQARDNIGAAEDFYVTPQMYGAKGDGVTDDTAAFQKAINTGRNVLVPMRDGQKYVITDTLVVSTIRQVIYGDTFNPDWGYGGCIYFNTSDGLLFDFKHGMNGCGNLSVYTTGSNNIAVRFKKDYSLTNIDGSIINCSFRGFNIAIDHYGRGLAVKRNVFMECNIAVKTTLVNDPQWDHDNPTRTELIQTYPEYNGRSLYIVDNRFHLTYDKYLIVVSEDYTSGSVTLKQVLNGAIITGNMADLGYGSFEFKAPIKGCIFNGNEFLRTSADVFFDCQEGAYDCSIANNTIRGVVDSNYPSMTMIGKDCFVFKGLEYSSIIGNVMENFNQRCICCHTNGFNHNTITGNVFKNYGINTSAYQYERTGIDIADSECSVISNNTFETVSAFNGYLIKVRNVASNVWKHNIFNSNTFNKHNAQEVLVPTTSETEDNIIQGVN